MILDAFGGGTSPDDERLDRTEIVSPNTKYRAVIDGFVAHDHLLFPVSFYSTLTIAEGGRSVLVGKLPSASEVRWVGESRLVVTLHQMRIPHVASSTLGVNIAFHLGDKLHVPRRRLEMEEREYASGECEAVQRNWQEERNFWAWARQNTDNGDPDPGPWASKIYPDHCPYR